MHLDTTLIIIIITCLVSVTAFYNSGELEKLLLWPAVMKAHRQYYRFVTAGFVHADWMHLAFNMITLYYFGRAVEVYFRQLFGPGVYLLFYLAAMVVADIQTFLKYREDYSYRALGASGAVSAVLFAAILFNPWAKIYLFFIPIGIPAFIFGGLYLVFCVYMSRKGNDGINHNAHLWGAIFGIVFTIVLEPRVAVYFLQQITAGS
jgi:membrane associated rhomboid family serine protease